MVDQFKEINKLFDDAEKMFEQFSHQIDTAWKSSIGHTDVSTIDAFEKVFENASAEIKTALSMLRELKQRKEG